MDHPEKPKTLVTSPGWCDFTTDWFTPRIGQWKGHVRPCLPEGPVSWLELGSYEGRSAIWTLENFLQHPESSILCVDGWFGEYEKIFNKNREAHPERHKITKMKGDATEKLIWLCSREEIKFDGIYLDADHNGKSVLIQSALCSRLLKSGGVLIIDDYPLALDPRYNKEWDKPIKTGADAFLDMWGHEFEKLHHSWQIILKKK
jgi:predicted O-methyltransferase YrrM